MIDMSVSYPGRPIAMNNSASMSPTCQSDILIPLPEDAATQVTVIFLLIKNYDSLSQFKLDMFVTLKWLDTVCGII